MLAVPWSGRRRSQLGAITRRGFFLRSPSSSPASSLLSLGVIVIVAFLVAGSAPAAASSQTCASLNSQIAALQDLLPSASNKAGIVSQIRALETQISTLRCPQNTSAASFTSTHCSMVVAGSGPCGYLPEFNLTAKTSDPNGLMDDPMWSGQNGILSFELPDPLDCGQDGFPGNPVSFGNPPCTTQDFITVDPPRNSFFDRWCALGGRSPSSVYHGHVNWTAATYEGVIQWVSHSPAAFNDDDYSWLLSRLDRAGETVFNDGGVGVEFLAKETIDAFQATFWSQFHQAVDSEVGQPQLIDGHRAIVTGLVGLDAAHSIATELHPAYAMAINAQHQPGHDVWAFFARNWGNEGYCSTDYHVLEIPTYKLLIPWEPGASSVRLGPQSEWYGLDARDYAFSAVPGVGVLLSVHLGSWWKGALADGQIDLEWLGADGQPIGPRTPRLDCASAKRAVQELEASVRRLFGSLVGLTGPERAGVLMQIASLNQQVDELLRHCPKQTAGLGSSKNRGSPPAPEVGPVDAAATESVLSARQRRVFREAYARGQSPQIVVKDSRVSGPRRIVRVRAFPRANRSAVRVLNVPGTGMVNLIRYAYCRATRDAAPRGLSCLG